MGIFMEEVVFLFFIFWPSRVAYGNSVPRPGIEPVLAALEMQSLHP